MVNAQPGPGGPWCKKGPCNGPVVVWFSSDNCDASHGATATQQVYSNGEASLSGQCTNKTLRNEPLWKQWTCGKDAESGLEAIVTKEYRSDLGCDAKPVTVSKINTRQCINLSYANNKQSAMYLCSQKDQLPFPGQTRVAQQLPLLNGATTGFCPDEETCQHVARITYYKDPKCQTPFYSTSLMALNTTAGAPSRFDQCYLDANLFLNQQFSCSSSSWSNSQFMSGCRDIPIFSTTYSTSECFPMAKGYHAKYQC
jgi:hypothetical protein